MFRDLYLSELEVLYKLAGELAERFPELAPMLGRDADPTMSRLLQRLAFAFGRVRERAEDDVPEIIHAVFEDLDPCILQPIASATMIELVPHPKVHRSPASVERGATFAGPKAVGRAGIFASTETCEVRPWALRHAERDGDGLRVRLQIELLASTKLAPSIGSDTIVLSLPGEPLEAALDLRAHLVRHTRRVRARAHANDIEIALAEGVSGAPPASRSDGRDGPRALGLVQDYFTHPRAFCRIAIAGARGLADLGEKVRTFELILDLDEALPPSLTVDATTLRLHCVPATSLSSVEASLEPTATPSTWLLRTSDPDDRPVEIEHVELADAGSRRAVTRWRPSSVTRSLDEDGGPLLFEVRRRPSVIDDEHDLAITFLDEEGPAVLPEGTKPRAHVFVTSAAKASELAIGDVQRATESSPVAMTFRNITPVTRASAAVPSFME